jgi:PAS domain S-box-containing protein
VPQYARASGGVCLALHNKLNTQTDPAQSYGAQIEALMASAPAGVAVLDAQLHVLYQNSVMAAAGAAPVPGAAGNDIQMLWPALAKPLTPLLAQVLASGESIHHAAISSGGHHWLASIKPVPAPAGQRAAIGVWLQEITAHKQVQDALAQSEMRLHMALEGANAGSWQWDAVADRAWWDDRYCDMYGFHAHEVTNHQSWIKHVASQDRARIDARLNILLNTPGDDLWREEYRIEHPVRGQRRILSLGRAQRDDHGRVLHMAGLNFDVTQQRSLQEALRMSGQRLRIIQDATQDFLGLLLPNGQLLEANRAALAVLPAAVRAHQTGQLFWQCSWFAQDPQAKQLIQNGVQRSAAGQTVRDQITLKLPGGQQRVLDYAMHPVKDSQGNVLYIVPEARDVTGQLQQEQRSALLLEIARLLLTGRPTRAMLPQQIFALTQQHLQVDMMCYYRVFPSAAGQAKTTFTCQRRVTADGAVFFIAFK